MNNPLLLAGSPLAFAHLEASLVAPAIDAALADVHEKRAALLASADNDAPFLNTLDRLTDQLDWAYGVVSHLESVLPDPNLRESLGKAQPKASAVWAALASDKLLYDRILAFRTSPFGASLTGVEGRFIDKTLDGLRRSGAALSDDERSRLQAIDVRLGEVGLRFSQHVVDDADAWHLTLTGEDAVRGLPATYVNMTLKAGEKAEQAGYRFTLSAPLVSAVLSYGEHRPLREAIHRAWNARASEGARDNGPLVREMLALRREKARLLGFNDFADLVAVERMAKTGARAHEFVRGMRHDVEAQARKEHEDLMAFAAEKLGFTQTIEAWDVAFIAEKLRAERYAFDEELLRDYLPSDHVVTTICALIAELFGLRFVLCTDLPKWHEAVQVFRIFDEQDTERGIVWVDLFPREGKRDGAWMDGLRFAAPGQPHLAVVCGNMSPLEEGGIARLQHRDMETILHEFGHLMHHVASTVRIASLGGTRVAEDFVEVPSQFLENWGWEPLFLRRLGKHWKTGEAIPETLIEALLRTRTFRSATAAMRQLGFGEVDMSLHREFDPDGEGGGEGPVARARAILEEHSPTKLAPEHAMIASFHHLFGSPVGYAAGYYVYKWAEVIEADFFDRVREEGIFNGAFGRTLRDQVYAVGNAVDANEIVRQVLGRDADAAALLRRSGLGA